MKLTKQQLKQIIKEELEVVLSDAEAKEFFGDDVLEDETLDEKKKKKKKKKTGFVKAAKEIEKKGTEGKFTKYCDGKVTNACIERGLKAGGKRAKQAGFAKAARTVAKDNK